MSNENESLGALHPSTRLYRFIVLFFVSMITFGSYFAYDIIGAMADTLVKELGGKRETVANLYTAYSIAAILSVFIGGLLIDWLGTRKSSMLFSILVLLGAIIVAVAESIPVLFIGRFIFGAGSEPLVVAQNAMLARWFKNKELALSFGISLTVARVGTLFSFNTGSLIADHFGGYRAALYASAIFCLVSLLANIVYVILDRRGEKMLELKDQASDKIVVKDIKNFGASYWYITLLCVTFYSAIFPFTALSTDFFAEKWKVPNVASVEGSFFYQVFYNITHMFNTAPGISSIIIFASMVLAPFAGLLVDKIGKRASLMILGSLLMIPAHLMMGLTTIYPAYSMIVLGAAFVLVPAAMWPAIPLVVKKEQIGTAFGLTTMIQNIGLALLPLINGRLRDQTGDYTASMIVFAALGFVGLVFAFLLKMADRKSGDIVEKP